MILWSQVTNTEYYGLLEHRSQQKQIYATHKSRIEQMRSYRYTLNEITRICHYFSI